VEINSEGAPVVDVVNSDSRYMPLLTVQSLVVHFRSKSSNLRRGNTRVLRAVDGIDLAIPKGATLGLVGETGSGKTTAGRAILQLYRPTSGSVLFDGIELTSLSPGAMRKMRRRMQMIFQDPYSSLEPRMRIGTILEEPLAIHSIADQKVRRDRVRELLSLVSMSGDDTERFPHELSGGQRQRIAIARALAVEPEFLVADEPVSGLDVSVQAQIIKLLQDLQDRLQLTLMFISHDLAVVRYVSTYVAVMYLGKIVEYAKVADLYENPLHPFTQALMSAARDPGPAQEREQRRIILSGDMPSPDAVPPGCRFRMRCPLNGRLGGPQLCASDEPELRELSAGHEVACHFAGT
jgi:oligopeptide transport system ATP-binding protein